MKHHSFLKCLALGALSLGAFTTAIFVHKESAKEIEQAYAWDSGQKPNVETSYYSSCEGKTGASLKTELGKFNKPKNKSY